ncbi:MAG TPA: hypothetical protein ENI87_04075 [bacterium]|nr:hypothetical protein [bacterium]
MNELFELAMGDGDERVRRALELLRATHPDDARLIELCSLADRDYAAAARELGIPEAAAHRRHYRALARLARFMDRTEPGTNNNLTGRNARSRE